MSLFNELKRRNVFKVGIAYLVIAWLIMQVADVMIDNIGAPDWLFKFILLVLGIGFPLAVFFAWAFEMTPEGIKKEKDVDRAQSITHQTGRKLDFMIIGVLVVALGYFIYESRFAGEPEKGSEPFSQDAAVDSDAAENEKRALTPIEATDNSIAVLPFANRSNLDDDSFFTDGIHDDLLTQLAKINDLKVISRTSMLKYKDSTKSIPEIAAELGVTNILEGGVQRAGKRVRINAQLIDVTTDEHLWAETFDREMTVENIFDIQSEITRQIVQAVRGELTEEETQALAEVPTDNLDAYEAYLHARRISWRPDYIMENFVDAQVWVTRALELDPEYAEAWALQVVIHGQYIWNSFDDSPERLAAMRDALDNANRYGLGKAEVLAAQAEYYYRVENDFHAAERALEAVIKSRPGDATFRKLMALTQRRTYKFEESISSFEAAIELDPGDAQGRTMLIETLLMMNEGQRAMPLLKRWVEAFPEARDLKALQVDALFYGFGDLERARKLFNQIEPLAGNTYFNTGINLTMLERDYPATLTFVAHPALASLRESVGFGAWMKLTEGMAHKLMNDDSSARELARQSIALMDAAGKSTSILNQSQVLTARAYAHFILDDIDKALELSNEAYTMFPESRDSVTGYQHAYTRAWLLGLAGQREAALEEVARLLNSPSGTTRWFLQLHPDWDYFRDDERFNELVRPDNLEDAVL